MPTEHDKDLRDPEMLLEGLRDIVDERGKVHFDMYGAPKEPAALKAQVEELYALRDDILAHPDISDADKQDITVRMEMAEGYLRGILESNRV